MGIYEKLTLIQSELKAPKSQYNSYGKYHYRSCEDILEALKPVLKKYKASLRITDDIVIVGDRIYVKATAHLLDYEDGTDIENTAFARESVDKKGMDAAQITGATSSYARKYALNGLFLIDDTKDADVTNESKTDEQLNQEMIKSVDPDLIPHGEGMTAPRIAKVRAELKRTGNNEKTILGFYKVAKLEDMTEAQYITVMNQLAKKATV